MFALSIRKPQPATPAAPRVLQRKLVIGASNDPLEREADRVAEQVMAARRPGDVAAIPLVLQRFASAPSQSGEAPVSVEAALATSGSPLDAAARRDMEPRFGRDFSQVRVHHGSVAEQSAREVGAQAYTVGHHMVFAAGHFAPATAQGWALLAHELTHVVQQGAVAGSLQRAPSREAPLVEPKQGVDPTEGEALAKELEALVAESDWEEMRQRLYEHESAVDAARAQKRGPGPSPETSGLGAIKALGEFAGKIGELQGENWLELAEPDRRHEIKEAANSLLRAAEVYEFQDALVNSEMPEQSNFDPANWTLELQEKLLSSDISNVDAAAELANALYHESRHAEQIFLSARLLAEYGATAEQIATDELIFKGAAKEAANLKLGEAVDKNTQELAERTHEWDMAKGDRATEKMRAEVDKLAAQRAKASAALEALKAGETPAALKAVAKARDALKQAMRSVEDQYARYRHLPEEADAHEVAAAAERVFRASK